MQFRNQVECVHNSFRSRTQLHICAILIIDQSGLNFDVKRNGSGSSSRISLRISALSRCHHCRVALSLLMRGCEPVSLLFPSSFCSSHHPFTFSFFVCTVFLSLYSLFSIRSNKSLCLRTSSERHTIKKLRI